MKLVGRTALVTGSTQGVGRAIAVALANAGANLVLHGLHDDDSAKEAIAECKQHNVDVDFLAADLSVDNESVFDFAKQVSVCLLYTSDAADE